MKKKLAEAIDYVREYCRANHYRCSECVFKWHEKCVLYSPHKWRIKDGKGHKSANRCAD